MKTSESISIIWKKFDTLVRATSAPCPRPRPYFESCWSSWIPLLVTVFPRSRSLVCLFLRCPPFSLTAHPTPYRIRSSPLLVLLLVLAAGFWLVQLLRSVCNLFSYWDIQVFYREALHIPPVSWVAVSVRRVP